MTGRTRRRGVRLESRAMPSEWLFLFAPGLRELLPFFPVHCFTSDRYRGTRYASGCFCLHRELRELLPCFPVHCFTCGLFCLASDPHSKQRLLTYHPRTYLCCDWLCHSPTCGSFPLVSDPHSKQRLLTHPCSYLCCDLLCQSVLPVAYFLSGFRPTLQAATTHPPLLISVM